MLPIGTIVNVVTGWWPGRRSRIVEIYLSHNAKTIYVLADGGFFGREEIEPEPPQAGRSARAAASGKRAA
jgi:hypothetical protein